MGDLESKYISTAYWEMISTLNGKFIEFDVSFTHDAGLGGELTSLIRETNSYYFVHHVRVNLLGRDGKLDILADTDEDTEHLPDTIFESEIPGGSALAADSRSSVAVVNTISVSGRPTAQSPEVEIEVDALDLGWIYTRIQDPAYGMLDIQRVFRSDGVEVDINNFWISRDFDDDYNETYTFHFLDHRANESIPNKYVLVYEKPFDDLIPPSSRLQYSGPWEKREKVFITPDTNIILLLSDNEGGSGVEQALRRVVGIDNAFVPASPFKIDTPGDVELEFYSVDRAGNQESINREYLYVDDAAPVVSNYQAAPGSFAPHAPRSVVSARETELHISAEDSVPSLQGTVEIATGEIFEKENVIRTFEVNPESGTEAIVVWDGRDKNDLLVASGIYTARLRLSDGLDWETADHTTIVDIQVEVAEWFSGEPVDANLSGTQLHPDVSGSIVVWQDRRNGNWDIYMKDIYGTGESVALVSDAAEQERPSVDGSFVVWQDKRNGDWDIYGYDLTLLSETAVSEASNNQERPVVSGEWIAWQDDSAGSWNIYAYNRDSKELIQVTSHERDQINPSLSEGVLAWEDYRHGLGEIYTYDLGTRTEKRLTYNTYTQTSPCISGDMLVWTDYRNEQSDVYYLNADITETRMTYGAGSHSHASASGGLVVYTDYETGIDDTNLSFYHMTSGVGARLTANPAHQEEPSVDSPVVVWQDDRDDVYQIYWAELDIEALPLEVELQPGFNLIAIGSELADTYQTSSSLIAADFGIEKVVTQNSLNDIYLESSTEVDIALRKGMGIGVYATKTAGLSVAGSGENVEYTLLPGLNYIGILTIRPGYTAYELIRSVGTDNIQSVQRYSKKTGAWETAVVREVSSSVEIVGTNFEVKAGEALVITMKKRVDGWRP
jgi:beta propeller repeat protein